MAKDYYEILGVDKNASQADIKRAYHKKAKEYHPDLNKSKDAEEKFKEVNQAYEILGDEQKRAAYDRFGPNMADQMGSSGFGGFGGFDSTNASSIFEEILNSFNMGGASPFDFGGSMHNYKMKGHDYTSNISITFIDSVLGIEIHRELDKFISCTACKGTGAQNKADIQNCDLCKGKGKYKQQSKTPFGILESIVTCQNCGGNGKIITNPCTKCKGKKIILTTQKVKIKIPAGINNGQKIVLEGYGGAGENGGPNGDLILIIIVEPHKYYTREKNDIHLEVPISFLDVLNETKIQIPTPYGKVPIQIPSSLVSGEIIKIEGKGFPVLNNKKFGNFYVHLNIFVPTLTLEERKNVLQDIKFNSNDVFEKWAKKVEENKK